MKFTDLFKPFVWVGTHTAELFTWFPRVFKIADDVEAIAPTALDEATLVFASAAEVAKEAVKDGGKSLDDIQAIVLFAEKVIAEKGLNIADDEQLFEEFKALAVELGSKSTWVDVATAIKNLVTNVEKFGATVQSAIAEIKQDVKS
jgi:hypothetical protein